MTIATSRAPPKKAYPGKFLENAQMGRILVKTGTTPAQTRSKLTQNATYMETCTVRAASDRKPLLKKISSDFKARDDYKVEKASAIPRNVAGSGKPPPGLFRGLGSGEFAQNPPRKGREKFRRM